jgi:hypothetical protein
MIDTVDAQASQRIDDMIYGQNDGTAGPVARTPIHRR